MSVYNTVIRKNVRRALLLVNMNTSSSRWKRFLFSVDDEPSSFFCDALKADETN